MTKYAKWLWIIGGGILAIGETLSAFDSEKGNTISETWRDAPAPLKFFVIFGMGAVFGHFVWPMPAKDVTVNIENLEVNKDGGT